MKNFNISPSYRFVPYVEQNLLTLRSTRVHPCFSWMCQCCYLVFGLFTSYCFQFSGCWLILCLYTYEFWLSLCKIARSSVILLLPLLFAFLTFLFCGQTFLFNNSTNSNETNNHLSHQIIEHNNNKHVVWCHNWLYWATSW